MLDEEYASADLIPAGWAHLYKETDDKFTLIKGGEIKTLQDVANVQEGLRKEREDHKATKANLAKFGGKDAETVLADLDKIEEYKLAAEGKMDDEAINKIVETRILSRTAPLERKIETLEGEKEELTEKVTGFETQNTERSIKDEIQKAAVASKVRGTALDDAITQGLNIMTVNEAGNVVTKDGVGVTPGVDSTVWLSEVKPNKPHWWPESEGVGANPGGGKGGGKNPFTKANWNRTEQGNMVRENPERAEQMAKAAGTTVGGKMPEK